MVKQRVLSLCTHNSARSQVAEGLLRVMVGDRFNVHRAGTEATAVRREAVRVMQEIGIDISGHESKTFSCYLPRPSTGSARSARRLLKPAPAQRLRWSLPDPSRIAGPQ